MFWNQSSIMTVGANSASCSCSTTSRSAERWVQVTGRPARRATFGQDRKAAGAAGRMLARAARCAAGLVLVCSLARRLAAYRAWAAARSAVRAAARA